MLLDSKEAKERALNLVLLELKKPPGASKTLYSRRGKGYKDYYCLKIAGKYVIVSGSKKSRSDNYEDERTNHRTYNYADFKKRLKRIINETAKFKGKLI